MSFNSTIVLLGCLGLWLWRGVEYHCWCRSSLKLHIHCIYTNLLLAHYLRIHRFNFNPSVWSLYVFLQHVLHFNSTRLLLSFPEVIRTLDSHWVIQRLGLRSTYISLIITTWLDILGFVLTVLTFWKLILSWLTFWLWLVYLVLKIPHLLLQHERW